MTFIRPLTRVNNGLQANDGTGDSLRLGANDINSSYAAIEQAVNALAASQGSGVKPYPTYAAMVADAQPDGVVAVVYADPTPASNTSYAREGGVWITAYDRLAYALGNGSGYQSGTGSDLRTVQDKMREQISIYDYMTLAQRADVDTGSPVLDHSDAILRTLLDGTGRRVIAGKARVMNVDNLVVLYASQIHDCDIDFQGAKIYWRGNRKTDGSQGQEYDWNWGVLSFKGEVVATTSTTLAVLLAAGATTITLASGHGLAVGDFVYLKITDPAAGGSTLLKYKLASRHCRVVGVSGNDVTFDFRTAFDMPSGATVAVSKLNPMTGIHVGKLNIEDISAYPYGGATTDDQKWKGASGVVFEYASFCTGTHIKTKGIPKVSCEAQACYRVNFEDCYLDTPKETVSGGYLCKFEDSLFFRAKGMTADNERHVVDCTASSQGKIEHSGSWKTANASFVTHGTYEHDITYSDCWGYMSMANSGTDFGQKSRRMKVDRHNGSNLDIASTGQNVYDSTFTDCLFSSVSYINADGNVFHRCDFGNLATIQQSGALSSRGKSVFYDTYFLQVNSPFISSSVSSPLEFHGGRITCLAAADILGTGSVLLDQAEYLSAGAPTFSGASMTVLGGSLALTNTANIITCTLPYLFIGGGAVVKAGFNYTGSSGSHKIVFDGIVADMTGRTTSAIFASAKTGGTIDYRCVNSTLDRTGTTSRHITAITSGAAIRMTNIGNTFLGGTINVSSGALGGGGLIHTGNVTVSTSTITLPTGANVVNANNLAL
ncbi:hypothetical protein [Dyella amyloliquefaciens]|uniref:hypothetical protein n=1 Tax=Dyella amyloliquefaciens TaxID=1770545 RepID=UPI00102E9673|nr:hypothetical protein [Dyella amyloliquefaciens]